VVFWTCGFRVWILKIKIAENFFSFADTPVYGLKFGFIFFYNRAGILVKRRHFCLNDENEGRLNLNEENPYPRPFLLHSL